VAVRSQPLKTRRLMRPYALFYLYRRRLRVQVAQELLAGAGIAVAVALVFASTVAQSSIAGSSSEVIRAVTGPASLELRARDSGGFPEALLATVEHLPGVRLAAPLLEQTATVRTASGAHTTIDLAGTDTSLAVLDGLGETLPLAALRPGTIGLSRTTGNAIGISRLSPSTAPQDVDLRMRGAVTRLRVSAVLGTEAIGALSRALVAVMPLARMQTLAGLPHRITRIFIQTQPGARSEVASELHRLVGQRLEVAPAQHDLTLLKQALGPSRLASGLFAAIGALLGFLFAFNAMLLTVPDRRQAIADLRLAGTRRIAILQMVLFEALCLGAAASLAGLVAGYFLSVDVFHQSSAYLAEAFTLGSSTVIGARPVILALAGGMLATCLASTVPLLDLRRGRSRDAVYHDDGDAGDALGASAQRRLLLSSVALLLLAALLYLAIPAAAIGATAILALGTVLAVPLALRAVLGLARVISDWRPELITLPVVLASLRTTTLRSLALAATGAVALFGSVALGASRANLLQGIRSFAHSYVTAADIWVTNPGDNQAVNEFSPGTAAARISAVPSVASVQTFQGTFLELGSRRIWIIARPPTASLALLHSEIQQGNAENAVARLAEGGWIVVSKKIAEEHHVTLGGYLTLPTPTGRTRMRIAATTTNLVWPPGAIFISTADYSRLWASTTPTALGVHLRPGMDPNTARAAIAAAIGPSSGLQVATAASREANINTLASEGLSQLREISTLLLIAAILAMAAALTSSLWQRRTWLSGLRLSGAKPGRLRRILLVEALLMLGAGCLTGALAGVYGEIVIDGYLRQVTGFPLASVITAGRPLEILALVLAAALLIMVIPGWLASRVPPALALESE
jgi:putative ABC transport system permease protein